jgi:hypothetical protein
MYKKITHSIVEEHYDHPMAAKIKASLRPNSTKKAKLEFEEDESLLGNDHLLDRITNEIFNKTVFKTDLENYLNTYSQKLIQITDTITGTEEQLVIAFEELFDFIDDIKNFFNPFYNRELGERVTTSFRLLASNTAMLSHAVKADFDVTPWETSLVGSTLTLGGPMINYNNAWTSPVIQIPMMGFADAVIRRAHAVKINNTDAITQATDQMHSSMTTFKNIIADGIIQQFPSRFTI